MYAVQDEVGRAGVMAISGQLGLGIIRNKADRDLYRELSLGLRDDGYLECLANDYGVTCAIVRLTETGLGYV